MCFLLKKYRARIFELIFSKNPYLKNKMNNLNELYEDLLCANSKDHILEDPIFLKCNHSACKNCIPFDSKELKCEVCKSNQTITGNENNLIKKVIKINLPELFDRLNEKISQEIKKYKCMC